MEDELKSTKKYFYINKMQNISLTKIAGAVKRLEADNAKTTQYLNVISQHENKLQELYSELQNLQKQQNNSNLSDEINELKSRSITDKDEIFDKVDNLKKDLLEAIKEKPVLTYDSSSSPQSSQLETREIVSSTPEFKSLDITNESKYAEYGSLDDVIQISLGDTKISIDKDDKDREICSLTNEVGGIAFKKSDSEDVWLMNRNKDSDMEFHFNTLENTPLSINSSGITTTKLSLNGNPITNIAKAINDTTINDKTVPTVGAIVKYINANLQKMNLMNKLMDGDVSIAANVNRGEEVKKEEKKDVEIISACPSSSPPSPPQCNISTISTTNGKSLLIENESNSFSLKDNEFNIISISASSTDGLRVGDKFKLNNNSGTLCKFVGNVNVNGEGIVGKFVELTGSVIKIDDLIIPEVRLSNKLSTMVYGIIKTRLQNEYVKENRIYKLDDDGEFVSVIKKGFIEISVNDGSFELGSLLVASKNGMPTYNKSNADAIQFCITKKVPMVKVISRSDDKLIVEVVWVRWRWVVVCFPHEWMCRTLFIFEFPRVSMNECVDRCIFLNFHAFPHVFPHMRTYMRTLTYPSPLK